MSFTDPQTVTINSVANPLPRTSNGISASTYSSADGNVKLTVSSSYGKRTRRTARIDFRKTAADPLFPAQNAPYSMSTYIVADVPGGLQYRRAEADHRCLDGMADCVYGC